jgi:hypothetical protein
MRMVAIDMQEIKTITFSRAGEPIRRLAWLYAETVSDAWAGVHEGGNDTNGGYHRRAPD